MRIDLSALDTNENVVEYARPVITLEAAMYRRQAVRLVCGNTGCGYELETFHIQYQSLQVTALHIERR